MFVFYEALFKSSWYLQEKKVNCVKSLGPYIIQKSWKYIAKYFT